MSRPTPRCQATSQAVPSPFDPKIHWHTIYTYDDYIRQITHQCVETRSWSVWANGPLKSDGAAASEENEDAAMAGCVVNDQDPEASQDNAIIIFPSIGFQWTRGLYFSRQPRSRSLLESSGWHQPNTIIVSPQEYRGIVVNYAAYRQLNFNSPQHHLAIFQ
ncbi:uncharacterized protein CTRU02_209923 [Colletotrichum truncatum]|uniref:Uncharacterized protein n=1 Tax=Colletotrichum truncatum TaxID=5467 RepID=A0ACC3YTX8_COLTU|nr:uncharacterized protein CTRU02_02493 [Colletotrichum truncatum]KAF6798519.1 hypothetical protein CTRU02_02493 [Colletotrichum truncatum]